MTSNRTLSVCVLSGKGGVGKSNIALNLGYCMFRGGFPLLLMDCDLGLANLDVLLGVTPEYDMQKLLDTDMDPALIAVQVEPGGFDFLPAASGVPELVEMDADLREMLFRKLSPLFSRYDYLFMDLGAGINPTVLEFASMAHVRLVIVTPEPTSLTDSYALIKVLATQHGVRDFHIIVNQVEDRHEEEVTFKRLAAACDKFLGITPVLLGGIRADKMVPESVRRQKPLLKMAPSSPAAHDLFALAVKLQRLRTSMQAVISAGPFASETQPNFE
ncbi:MinD/ParA family protein [Desulfovibrio psychrotolerans]|uniref:Site-determining protein n=1 Tax=Desulfovibrio psychrotolerans TaxID=415242 RepID=A0A7J0BNX5_9BACT|nr:MinD/ParA family protein [Desulfovibrio psychrotolerans]GFM35396.1 site-determining protein [Desulfovibrio psychrotolerans]